MKILLVYNPFAGHGRGQKLLPRVQSAFESQEIEVDLITTEYKGNGTEIVAKADFTKYDGVVAAGGDGTLFEVINGYYKNTSGKKIPLGVLPVGTGNAFARDLDLHTSDWEKAIGIIGDGKTKKVDVGRFSTNGTIYYYLNILGIGFVSDVTATAHQLKVFGNISYTFAVFYQTLRLNSNRVQLEIDGKALELDATFIEISNTRYTANFLMAPAAKIDDGLLDVTIAKKLNRRKLLSSFPKIFTGEHVNLDEVDTYQAKNITIHTDVPKIMTPDGEILGETPTEVTCLANDVEVFWK